MPVLSIIDLGIIRNIETTSSLSDSATEEMKVKITITPTYSGCPAMDDIAMDIRLKLIEKGHRNVSVRQQLSPAWTTDWMSEEGKRKLEQYGIAPPVRKA